MKLVFIHGINNEGSSAAQIVDKWRTALIHDLKDEMKDILVNAECRAVYYGDDLANATDDWLRARSDVVPMSGGNDLADREILSFYKEYQLRLGIEDGDIDLDSSIVSQGENTQIRTVKAVVRAIDESESNFGEFLTKKYLPQAAAYLHKPGLSTQIDSLVDEQLKDIIDPQDQVVMLCHSLGTVIGYKLLRKNAELLTPNLFLTLGSPLGSKTVQTELGYPRPIPGSVKRWVNVSDPLDFIVLQSHLDKHTFGNNKIENFTVINDKDHRHSISEYLSHDVVRQSVVDSI